MHAGWQLQQGVRGCKAALLPIYCLRMMSRAERSKAGDLHASCTDMPLHCCWKVF
jgi:hypothetical protein